MKNFKLVCPGDNYTKSVSATTMEEAVQMFLMDEEVKAHVTQTHPEMVGKTPEEMTQMVTSMVSEDMGGAMPAA